MAELVLKGLNKRFGELLVVRDVDLDIADGELVVLVGPSGCGKSTTLRMVAGLEEITSGDLFIAGKRVNDVHPKDRDIAMVFQSYALYPHMNVADNMSFGLKMRGMKKDEIKKRVDGAADILGLTDLLNRKPKEMSGGQRQRVAMGRAIVREPQVFLFDEPLSNLDAKLRVQMRAEIAKLHRRIATTILYVTHDQVEAMTLADRIVIMDGGRVQQVGTPLEVYEHPKNRFVAGFIGSPAMNFVQCTLEAGEQPRLKGDGFSLVLPELHRRALEGREGAVELGIRPLHLEAEAIEGPPAEASAKEGFVGTVEVIEPMGSETYLYVRYGDETITVREEAHCRLTVGQKVMIKPNLEHVHLFDQASGEAYL